jgi:Flp pilus assembly protein TadB
MQLSQALLFFAVALWCLGLLMAIRAALLEAEAHAALRRAPLPALRIPIMLIAHYAARGLGLRWRARQMTRLLQAGLAPRITPPEWFALRCLGSLLAGGAVLGLGWRWPGLVWIVLPVVLLAGWWLPEAWLVLRMRRHQHQVAGEFTLCLELLVTGLESGLHSRQALELAAECSPHGPAATVLHATLDHGGAGPEVTTELLRRLGWRMHSPAVCAAIAALLRAERSGVGLQRAVHDVLAQDARVCLARREGRARRLARRLYWSLALCFAPAFCLALALPLIVEGWLQTG